jgi:hypothetical protein
VYKSKKKLEYFHFFKFSSTVTVNYLYPGLFLWLDPPPCLYPGRLHKITCNSTKVPFYCFKYQLPILLTTVYEIMKFLLFTCTKLLRLLVFLSAPDLWSLHNVTQIFLNNHVPIQSCPSMTKLYTLLHCTHPTL